MKVSKKLILKVAIRVMDERGLATQFDIHTAIEETINRQLSAGEKRRITYILSDHFVRDMKREGHDGIRVYIFRR